MAHTLCAISRFRNSTRVTHSQTKENNKNHIEGRLLLWVLNNNNNSNKYKNKQKQNTFGSSFWLAWWLKTSSSAPFSHIELRFIKRPPAFFVCVCNFAEWKLNLKHINYRFASGISLLFMRKRASAMEWPKPSSLDDDDDDDEDHDGDDDHHHYHHQIRR